MQDTSPFITVTVLGTAQDGGVPQPGCYRNCCLSFRCRSDDCARKMQRRRYPVSLGIVGIDGSNHLVEASRFLGDQLDLWRNAMKGRAEIRDTHHRTGAVVIGEGCSLSRDCPLLHSLSITHAHLGHIDGLGLFGREVMNVRNLPLHCSSSLAELLHQNPVWKLLCDQKVIIPTIWKSSGNECEPFEPSLGCGFHIRPIRVPHRAELSDMHALVIEGPNKKLLFLPDHDSWEETLHHVGEPSIRQWLKRLQVDIALLDGTFWNPEKELGLLRDVMAIPHPPVPGTLDMLGKCTGEDGDDLDVRFIHLNHTNPLCKADSKEMEEVIALGWKVSSEGDTFVL